MEAKHTKISKGVYNISCINEDVTCIIDAHSFFQTEFAEKWIEASEDDNLKNCSMFFDGDLLEELEDIDRDISGKFLNIYRIRVRIPLMEQYKTKEKQHNEAIKVIVKAMKECFSILSPDVVTYDFGNDELDEGVFLENKLIQTGHFEYLADTGIFVYNIEAKEMPKKSHLTLVHSVKDVEIPKVIA